MATSTVGGRRHARAPRTAASERTGIHLGRVAGVEIRLDWSLLVIFALISVNLGGGLFPSQHPDWNPALSWTTALLAALLFFASVLAHELGHAVVARRHGVPIEGITLFFFGGVARMGEEPKTPRAELAMAIVGPLISLAIGAVAIALGLAFLKAAPGDTNLLRKAGPLATLLLWLGPINLMLGVFNLVPAFPLDGGRAFRAIVWAATGDLVKATRWASGAGRVAAMLLIFAGVTMIFGHRIPWLGGGSLQGLWLILLGWFLMAAAIEGYRQVVARGTLRGLPAARPVRSASPAISTDDTLEAVATRFLQSPGRRYLPVAAGGRIAGLIGLSDLSTVPRERWSSTTVGTVMTPLASLISVPSDEALDVLSRLVVEDGNQLTPEPIPVEITEQLKQEEPSMDMIARRWWIFLIRGIAGILFGLLTLISPRSSLFALVILFGAYALVDGVFTLALSAIGPRPKPWGALIFHGIAGIAAGVVTLLWPGISAFALLMVIAAWAVVTGVAAMAAAIRLRKQLQGEWMLALTGVLAIIFGVLVFLFPAPGALAVVLWIGAWAIVTGGFMLGLAFRLRSWGRHLSPSLPMSAPA
jgi:Zn-dependent protease/uncharacterized membrane protein HdeD (DUF308 family)